jgi:hypothetical protein
VRRAETTQREIFAANRPDHGPWARFLGKPEIVSGRRKRPALRVRGSSSLYREFHFPLRLRHLKLIIDY